MSRAARTADAALLTALEAALRNGAHGRVDEAWLRRAFPGQWAALRDLLRLEAEIGGGIKPGATLGPFRVIRLLGRGTSSSVHLAVVRRRVFGLRVGHVVALKVLHAYGAMRPAAKARLRREARAGRRVVDPRVVRVWGALNVRMPQGIRPAVAMDVLDGETLAIRLRRDGPLPPADVARLAKDALRALDAVHSAGILHRDVKPGNLVRDARGRVCLLDLGFAWLASERRRLTPAGGFLGSLAYAAPESLSGGRTRPDARADLFSLGVTLFEAATGARPWPSAMHAPRTRSRAGALERRLGGRFATWVRSLLAFDPAERPPSARAALRSLDQALSRTPGRVGSVRHPRSRRRAVASVRRASSRRATRGPRAAPRTAVVRARRPSAR